jgi:glyoxylase-like metal-dependent hydrolase (beta-lactamase superfamily II)
MFEQVTSTVRYAKAPTAIGVVTHGDRALLVDSGLDENLVRKVLNALAKEGVEVAAVVNTHAHADHFGGNHFAVKRTGCKVVAPAFEHHFIERPELEGWTLFGAPAPRALQGKFILAQPSRVDVAVEREGALDVEGFDVRFHALPGHSVAQMGVEVDGVLFVGDALLPDATVQKYGLVFAVDPAAARASQERLLATAPAHVVSYHGGLVHDLAGSVRANIDASLAVEEEAVRSLSKGPRTADEVFLDVCDRFGTPTSVELYALNLATLRSYLAALERSGRAESYLDGNRWLWRLR